MIDSRPDRHRNKIVPRNLTARAAYNAVGNPANTRLESGVANCFPGLEFDVRTLDTRFFPGLMVQYVTTPLRPTPDAVPNQQGARVLYLDYQEDPMLPETSPEPWVQTLLTAYRGPLANTFLTGRWYLQWLEQDGHRLSMYDDNQAAYDGELVWRLVRSLRPDSPVTISIVNRDAPADAPIGLTGFRRKYVNAAGVIDAAYRAGEFTQAMCNPWTHDFRDCACHYWASNHPDIVLGEVTGAIGPSEAGHQADDGVLPDGDARNPIVAETYLDWIRDDQRPSGAASALNTIGLNRPFQIDHYQINTQWQRLRFVLEGREIAGVYQPRREPAARPYVSTEEMIDALERELAPLEFTLAAEYLYALFSVRDPAEVPADRWPSLRDDVVAIKRFLLLVAVGEMTHLRWANQLLWLLDRAGLFPRGRHYRPIVDPIDRVRMGVSHVRPRRLRPLTPATMKEFVAIERPGGLLDTAYARCVATLEERGTYPPDLYELAVRIDTDGNEHYSRFRQIQLMLDAYPEDHCPYLRPITIGTEIQARAALDIYAPLLDALRSAYRDEAAEHFARAQEHITRARTLMDRLRATADELARAGIGVPFFAEPALAAG
jgi:hypothetical protein